MSQSHGREMATCRVARDIELRRVATVAYDVSVNPGDDRARLTNNIGDRHVRTQVVLGEDNRSAALYERRREVAIVVFAAAAPVAAVDVNKHGTCRSVRRIDVKNLARGVPVRDVEPGL